MRTRLPIDDDVQGGDRSARPDTAPKSEERLPPLRAFGVPDRKPSEPPRSPIKRSR